MSTKPPDGESETPDQGPASSHEAPNEDSAGSRDASVVDDADTVDASEESQPDQARSIGEKDSSTPTSKTVRSWNYAFSNPTFLSQILRSTVSSIPQDVPKGESAETLVASAKPVDEQDWAALRDKQAHTAGDIRNEILQAERDRLSQQKSHRQIFFVWAVIGISVVILFGAGMFTWHMFATEGQPSEAVMISWMTTSIVEIIGLGYIIGRSLFRSETENEGSGSQAAARTRSAD